LIIASTWVGILPENLSVRRIAFSKLLVLLAGAPLIAAILYAGTLTYQSWSRYDDLVRASSLLKLATAAARLGGTAIPSEAAPTRAVIAGTGDRAALEAARRRTDELYRAVMQAATQESVAAIKEICGTIGRISEISSTISTALDGQGLATDEIARNAGAAARSTAEVASNITEVNRGAGDTGSESARVLSSAQSLSRQSTRLRAEVERFLQTVRAA
jgi:methyl-accepting chemotaxis protein